MGPPHKVQGMTSRLIACQLCDPELLPRSSRGYSCVRHHQVRCYVNLAPPAHRRADIRSFYRIGSRASFSKLARWLEDARALGSQHLVAVLVGNKSDREEEREVEWAEASRWAAEHGEVTWSREPGHEMG